MSYAQYTNINYVKRVKQTHNGSWFISAEKELKEDFQTPDVVRTWKHVVEPH